MADYHIYLHSDTATGSKTKPFRKRKEKTETQDKKTPFGTQEFQKVVNTMTNPDSLVSQGIGAVAKAVPVIACAYAVVKLADKITSTIIDFNTISSGDFSHQINYQNFKSIIHGITTPFSSSLNYAKAVHQANVNQYRVNEQMRLLGDSVINSGYNNNYGV